MRITIQLLIPGALALTAGLAAAQPVPIPIPLPPPTGDPVPPDGTKPPDGSTPPDGTPADGSKPPPPIDDAALAAEAARAERERIERERAAQEELDRAAREAADEPRPRLDLPELLLAPAGVMLPGGVIYSRSGVDTSGGFSSDLRFGLGDVAEFGVAMTDLIRARPAYGVTSERLSPYYTATFRMGIAEHRLFRHQPAVALGFRKSFEFEEAGQRSRIAELHVAATKHLGKNAAVHLNGAVWDASVEDVATGDEVLLHDQGLRQQIRVGGGFEIRAVDDADVMVDLGWIPELCYTCTAPNRIKLRPVLSWGVRYDLTRWAQLQSGVRVPDIGDANLLDAQIFGQLTIINSTLRRVVDRKQRR